MDTTRRSLPDLESLLRFSLPDELEQRVLQNQSASEADMFNLKKSRHQLLSNPQSPGRIGIVMATYNQPEQLAKSLLSYTLQSDSNFDVILADDGSDDRTAAVVDRFSSQLSIQHVWHPDNGFGKCEILNKAIAASDHDYLIFTDGDCIAAPDLVAIHRQFAEPSCFLSGTYNNLPPHFKDIVTEQSIESQDAFDLRWLRQQGLPKSKMDLRMHRSPMLRRILNATTTTRPNWNGCNASGWRSDLVAVNGFDERMGHGGLDRELGYRLENAGVRGRHARFFAICLHCDHSRGYANATQLQKNHKIRDAAKRKDCVRTSHGIDEMLQRHPPEIFIRANPPKAA